MAADVPTKPQAAPRRAGREGPWFLRAAWSLVITGGVLIGFAVAVGLYWFRPTFIENGAAAEKLADSLLKIDIPPQFQPAGTIEWNIAYLLTMRGAYFEMLPRTDVETASGGLLVLLEVDTRFRDDVTVRKHIQSVLLEEGAGGPPLIPIKSDDLEFDVQGEQRTFRVTAGKQPNSEAVTYLVQGLVNGRKGDVMIALRLPKEDWDEEGFARMLKSIQ